MRVTKLLLVLIVCLLSFANLSSGDKSPTQYQTIEKLKRDLFTHYDKAVRPAEKNHTIDATLNLELKHLDFNERKGLITVYGVLDTSWRDPKLAWNPSDYSNLNDLHLTCHEIWIPDITLYNDAANNILYHFESGLCSLNSTGHITWAVQARLEAYCDMDLKHWPLDSHNCTLVFGSWTYDGYHLDLFATPPTSRNFIKNAEFSISGFGSERVSTVYPCCAEPYISIKYHMMLNRRPSAFCAVFIPPVIAIMLLSLACVCLPAHRTDKILVNGINTFLIMIFILYIAKNVPAFSFRTPVYVIFLVTSLFFVTFSTIISVFVISAVKFKPRASVPPGLNKILKGHVGRILGVNGEEKKPDQTELRQHFEDGKTNENRSLIKGATQDQAEWVLFLSAIERVSFLVYCLGATLIGIYAIF